MCALHPEYAAKSEQVAHLWGGGLGNIGSDLGGMLGSNGGGASAGPNAFFGGSGAGSQFGGGLKGLMGAGSSGNGALFSGAGTPWGPKTGSPSTGSGSPSPRNNFSASAPPIDTSQNWTGGMNTGTANIAAGQQNLGTAYGAQMGAGSQLGGIANAQLDQAGKINNLSGQQQGVLGQQEGLYSQQQGLANQLQDAANGGGPNPAQLQYQQNVNQGIQQNTGMIASQKGMNPALAARMAAQSGAQQQQAAAGNEATLQAQQQLAARGQLAGQQQAMGSNLAGQGQTLQGIGGTYGQASGAIGAAGNAYGQQGGIYSGAAGTANDMAGQGNAQLGHNVAGYGAQNSAINTGSLGSQDINFNVAKQNATTNGGILGGALNGIGAVVGPGLATAFGSMLGSGGGGAAADGASAGAGEGAAVDGIAATAAHGGEITNHGAIAPGADGKALSLAHALMAMGGQVQGKAAHPGDDPRNDVVPTVLSKGEVVLPNSITQSPDAAQKAAEFIEHLKAQTHPSYGQVIKARAALAAAQAKHQKMSGKAA